MLLVRLGGGESAGTDSVALRCPACGNDGTFTALGTDYKARGDITVGHRRCPNPECSAHVFIVRHHLEILATYPARRITFDRGGIPERVLAALDEAITCHANQCWMAAGMMIRKTLEEICADQKAEGKDLNARIEALEKSLVLPRKLLAGMHHLRILGNDAAHVEIRHFQAVSQKEIEVAIEFTQTILRAVYQYDTLLRRIEELRVPESS
jgi:hypothetical protein